MKKGTNGPMLVKTNDFFAEEFRKKYPSGQVTTKDELNEKLRKLINLVKIR